MMATQPWVNGRAHVYNVCTETECSLLDLMSEIHEILKEVAPTSLVMRRITDPNERATSLVRSAPTPTFV